MTVVPMQVDQDCFVKGEEDMVNSGFKAPPSGILSNGVLSYTDAELSADASAQGAVPKVGRAASARAASGRGAAENIGALMPLGWCSVLCCHILDNDILRAAWSVLQPEW